MNRDYSSSSDISEFVFACEKHDEYFTTYSELNHHLILTHSTHSILKDSNP